MENLIFRKATIDDLNALSILEIKCWGEAAATKTEIEYRLINYPDYFHLIIVNGEIKSFTFCIPVSKKKIYQDDIKWKDIYTVIEKGQVNTIYGISLTSDSPDGAFINSYSHLMMINLLNFCKENHLSFICGSRIADFYKWDNIFDVKKYINIYSKDGFLYEKINHTYIDIRTKDSVSDKKWKTFTHIDKHLRFFSGIYPKSQRIIKVIDNYYEDYMSLDYGVIIEWTM